MIKDSVANIALYSGVGERIEMALKYLETVHSDGFAEDTVELSETDVYAMHQLYTTKPAEGRFYENHKAYIDVQFVLEGSEVIRVTDVKALSATTEYDEKSDYTLYALAEGTDVKLASGDFVVLFPHDAHVPQLADGSPSDVKKVVLKVRV